METFTEYRAIYDELITKKAKFLIIKYDSIKENYEYQPYSHVVNNDAIDRLADLILDDMVFYVFTEEEILDMQRNFGILNDLKIAAQYAYHQRLPKRKDPNTDGTTGEILFDILIQVYEPKSQKLIARAKYRQLNDNQEIKGYDAMYFTKDEQGIYLWLGQVKTGDCSYCTKSIVSDLNEKYLLDYFCNVMYYIADKGTNRNNDLIRLINKINELIFKSFELKWSNNEKKKALIDLIKSENIKIKIPCVLAYTADIYSNVVKLEDEVKKWIDSMIKKFDNLSFSIDKGLDFEIIFYIFPIKDIKSLRSKIVQFKRTSA
jgi:hypothetical protein